MVRQEDVWDAPHYRGTYGFIAWFQTRLMLVLLSVNVFVHMFMERSLYVIMLSLAVHTTVRLGLVATYPGPPSQLVEEWMAFMSWDVCGLSIVLVHACMGLFFGLRGGLLRSGPIAFTMAHGVAMLRMMPALTLAVRAGSVEVLKRSLVRRRRAHPAHQPCAQRSGRRQRPGRRARALVAAAVAALAVSRARAACRRR